MRFPKIAFVRQKFSRFGGGELILDRTIGALAKRGAAITIIAREWEPHAGIEFRRCDPARSPRTTRDSRFARAACEIIATLPGALVQSHERLSCCDIYRAGDGVHAAYLAHRARGLSAVRRFFQNVSGYHRDVLRLEREMFTSPRLKAVIVNAQMVADEIVAHFAYPRERIHLIQNGIDLSRFDEATLDRLRAETRNKLGLSGRKVLVIVGSGYERKGVAQAIEALARSKSGAALLVIGHEKRISRYRSLAKRFGVAGGVHFLGKQENVLPYLAASDAMILPSIYDPFPSAALEGFAAGLPVITSDACGARDIAREIDPGLVRDANDIDGLSEAIKTALALSGEPETKQRTRAIAARFDMESMAERMLALYERVAGEK
ncbi:MAG: glycosyltransferase family 4 protein [Xanthobacteraceae bacterium]|nr:glycosyltransferase family 4 protein [Xanthobacteraceae bacterium]MBX3548754.1 glycosyltransferase family 4 protein [Xanthobacteraceae bacterium]MCW5674388.1 glycosyltransferase family 4 protein [Xanthobacteraceae bacterium]